MLSAPFSNWPACVEPHRYIRWPTFFIWANEIWSKTEGDLHTPRVRYTNILASCHTPIMVAHMKSWKWYKELRCNINRTRSRSPAIARRSRSSWMPFRRETPRWALLSNQTQSKTITPLPLLLCLIHIPLPSLFVCTSTTFSPSVATLLVLCLNSLICHSTEPSASVFMSTIH